MKRYVLVLLVALGACPTVFAADDAVTKATKLLERHRYDETAALLEGALTSLATSQRGPAHLALGTAYLRSAELYQELGNLSAEVNSDYLRRLAAARWSRSTYADLYYAEALIQRGRYSSAVKQLERFIANDKAGGQDRQVARVLLGICAYRAGDKQRAESIWGSVDSSDDEVKLELAAAFSRLSVEGRNPGTLCEEGLAGLKRTRRPLSIRAVKNAIAVYSGAGQLDRGIALAREADLKAPAFSERVRKRKEINFYTLSLLDDLGNLFLKAAIASLEKAAQDPKFGDTAAYYLGEAYALAGRRDLSVKYLAQFMANSRMPQQVRDRAAVLQAANSYRQGRRSDAINTWETLSRERSDDPALVGQILSTCGGLRVDCPAVVKRAEVIVETGQGKKFSPLNAGIGRYYLGNRKYSRSLGYLEAARDKGNKNKIEANDPLLLVGLSDAYYRTKKYSEALEIYFEMSKHVPAVRQVQEALQGIYSMEQKSAGDVKIF